MSEPIYSAEREFDEVIRKLRRDPRLLLQMLKFAKMSLELHERQFSGPVTLRFRDGIAARKLVEEDL